VPNAGEISDYRLFTDARTSGTRALMGLVQVQPQAHSIVNISNY
jgi:hypothetical protein